MPKKYNINEFYSFFDAPNMPGFKTYNNKKEINKRNLANKNFYVDKTLEDEYKYLKDSFKEIGQLFKELEDSIKSAFPEKEQEQDNEFIISENDDDKEKDKKKKKDYDPDTILDKYGNKFKDIRKVYEDLNFTYKVFYNFNNFFNKSKYFNILGSKKRGATTFTYIGECLKAISYSVSIGDKDSIFGNEGQMSESLMSNIKSKFFGYNKPKFNAHTPYFIELKHTVLNLKNYCVKEYRFYVNDDNNQEDREDNNQPVIIQPHVDDDNPVFIPPLNGSQTVTINGSDESVESDEKPEVVTQQDTSTTSGDSSYNKDEGQGNYVRDESKSATPSLDNLVNKTQANARINKNNNLGTLKDVKRGEKNLSKPTRQGKNRTTRKRFLKEDDID